LADDVRRPAAAEDGPDGGGAFDDIVCFDALPSSTVRTL
jgi:hypothetical protein